MRRLGIRFGLAGVAGAALLALLLLSPVGGGSPAHAGGPFCNATGVPVPILDNSTATVDCTPTDAGAIKDLNVFVGLTHTFTSDLRISLTHVKTGTTVSLITKRCGGDDNISAFLDDEATDPVGSVCPIAGSFQPESPLSAFDGEGFAGVWRLSVTDQVTEDEGEITAFRLSGTTNHGIKKDPSLANLWLCNQGNNFAAGNRNGGCHNTESGVEEVSLNLELNEQVISPDPKCPTLATEPDACARQSIGSLGFEVRYDAKFLTLSVVPAPGIEGMQCIENHLEGIFQAACVTKGKPPTAPSGPLTIAVLHVRPTADVYSLLIANQENGIATQLINQDCNLSDLQGHPIVLVGEVCQDAAVTIRYLEGDIHADCIVDVLDQQQIAFRWGSRLGNLLYNSRMDLEPSAPKKGDGDIDAKDLQFVYGRHGSTCKDPHPAQDPVDPKAKPPVVNGD